MYYPIAVFIGVRYIINNRYTIFERSTFWLSAIGIFLGVSSLIIILSVMNGFENKFKNSIIQFIPHALVTNKIGNINPNKNTALSLKSKNIKIISPLVTAEILLQNNNNISIGTMLGIDFKKSYEPLMKYLIDYNNGTIPEPGSYKIILGAALAIKMQVNIGDRLNLIIPSVNYFTIFGKIPSKKIFTVSGIYYSQSEVDEYQIIIDQQDAANIMNYKVGNITGWRLFLKKPLAIDNFSNQKLPSGLILKDWRNQKGDLFQAMKIEKNMMGLLLSLIIVVAVFNIITSLNLIITEKRNDIAILKTQGLTNKNIIMTFIVQGTSSGIIGVIFGLIIGLLIINNLNHILSIVGWFLDISIFLPTYINYYQIITICSVSIFIILLSTIYPSWYAASVRANEILRYE